MVILLLTDNFGRRGGGATVSRQVLSLLFKFLLQASEQEIKSQELVIVTFSSHVFSKVSQNSWKPKSHFYKMDISADTKMSRLDVGFVDSDSVTV